MFCYFFCILFYLLFLELHFQIGIGIFNIVNGFGNIFNGRSCKNLQFWSPNLHERIALWIVDQLWFRGSKTVGGYHHIRPRDL